MANVETSMPASSQSVTVRPAAPDDEDFLAQLFASTRPEFGFLDLPDSQKQFLMTMQFNAQRQQYDASYPEAENSIILLHGEPVGRIMVDRSEREFTLIDIALLPAHRNAGIGTNLIRTFLDEARAARKTVRLHVAKSNPARRLYERLGFSLTADQSMYFEMVLAPHV